MKKALVRKIAGFANQNRFQSAAYIKVCHILMLTGTRHRNPQERWFSIAPIVSQVRKNAFGGEKSVDSTSPLW
jgi:hypothetical protein